ADIAPGCGPSGDCDAGSTSRKLADRIAIVRRQIVPGRGLVVDDQPERGRRIVDDPIHRGGHRNQNRKNKCGQCNSEGSEPCTSPFPSPVPFNQLKYFTPHPPPPFYPARNKPTTPIREARHAGNRPPIAPRTAPAVRADRKAAGVK